MSDLRSLLQQAQTAHSKPQPRLGQSPNLCSDNPPRQWTKEQEDFLNDNHPQLLLSALAGTGKTTLLMEYARRRPHQTWSFLAFNRSVIEEWKNKAPKNVRLSTVHQLALKQKGVSIQHKIIEQPMSSNHLSWMTPYDEMLQKRPGSPSSAWSYQDIVKECLWRYLYGNTRISDISLVEIFNDETNQDFLSYCTENQKQIVTDVRALWQAMIDPSNTLPIIHDVYLKVFSLSSFEWKGQWMLDEAQDWSPAFYQNFVQKCPRHLVAGDPFQKLYEFRMAQKHLSPTPNQHQHWLTQSFRQGTGAEETINLLLKKLSSPVLWKAVPSFSCRVSHASQNLEEIQSFNPSVVLAYDNEKLKQFSKQFPHLSHIPRLTIHASKGLEFSNVWICDDALPVFVKGSQRLSLWYVAITRAQHALRLPPQSSFLYKNPSTEASSLLQSQDINFDED